MSGNRYRDRFDRPDHDRRLKMSIRNALSSWLTRWSKSGQSRSPPWTWSPLRPASWPRERQCVVRNSPPGPKMPGLLSGYRCEVVVVKVEDSTWTPHVTVMSRLRRGHRCLPLRPRRQLPVRHPVVWRTRPAHGVLVCERSPRWWAVAMDPSTVASSFGPIIFADWFVRACPPSSSPVDEPLCRGSRLRHVSG